MAGLSPLGHDWATVGAKLRSGVSGVTRIPEWEAFEGLQTRLAARVSDFEMPGHWPRKKTRTMGRVSQLAARASELALADAGLTGSPLLTDGATGVSYGSTSGSPPAMEIYARQFLASTVKGIAATDYVQFMSHTCAANLAVFFGLRGRLIPTCSACTSGSQGIGFAYETIRTGRQAVMLAGGAEELHPIDAAATTSSSASSSSPVRSEGQTPSLAQRVEQLETEVATLRQTVTKLAEALGEPAP